MLASAGNIGHITRQPYEKLSGLDGYKYLIYCDTVAAIDRFFMSECSAALTQTQLAYTMELIGYEDGVIARDDLEALDAFMAEMVISGMECAELRGDYCG
jgi:hypothetical protein